MCLKPCSFQNKNELMMKKGEEEHASKRSRVCDCGRDSVEKVVGPRSANRGLRYLCCDNFVFFGKKKNSCRFFEWIDQPRLSKEQRREAEALLCKGRGATSGEKQCKTTEGLQVKKENFELEIRVSEGDLPQTQDVRDAAQMPCNDCYLIAKHLQSSPTNAVQPETGRCELNSTLQQNKAVVEDVQGLNHSVGDTIKGADTSITQIHPNLSELPKDKDTNQEGKQSLEYASESLDIPECLCLRAAVLKTAKSKGPSKGLRFWVCSNSQPFYVKKKKSKLNSGEESCKFFRWVDTPFEKSDTQKKEENQRRKETRKRKELSLLS